MEITKEQHAINAKNMMLNMADALHNAIKRGDNPSICKKFLFWRDKLEEYCNDNKLFN